MAREKVAERTARLTAQGIDRDQKAWAEFLAEYNTRLAKLMFNFLTQDPVFTVVRVDDTYSFSRNNRYSSVSVLSANLASLGDTYNHDVINAMENAEYELDQYLAEMAAQLAQHHARQNALNKLSAEEKELLGL